MRNFEKALGSRFPAERPLFYYITDRKSLPGQNLLCSIQRTVEWGVDFVQIREKGLEPQRVQFLLSRALSGTPFGSLVVVNSDCGTWLQADGVHLASRALMAATERPAGRIVGASCHDAAEVARREAGTRLHGGGSREGHALAPGRRDAVTLGLSYADSDLDSKDDCAAPFQCDGQVVASVSKAF